MDSCHREMEPKPTGSQKEKVNAVLEDFVSRPEDYLLGCLCLVRVKVSRQEAERGSCAEPKGHQRQS